MAITTFQEIKCDMCNGLVTDTPCTKKLAVARAKKRGAIITKSGKVFCCQGCKDAYENK